MKQASTASGSSRRAPRNCRLLFIASSSSCAPSSLDLNLSRICKNASMTGVHACGGNAVTGCNNFFFDPAMASRLLQRDDAGGGGRRLDREQTTPRDLVSVRVD